MIYLDNAATTLQKPQEVIDAVTAAMTSMGNSARGLYPGALLASRTIYDAREKLAQLFGCPRADHVVFTANSTEALNIAISGLLKPGDHVISTDLEHNSVLRPLYRLREQGVEVSFAAADKRSCLAADCFAPLLRPNTRMLVCTHASNLTGNLLPVDEIGRFAHDNGLLFVVDASQTAGAIPIHMGKQNIDVLCFTGHKSMLGPQGTGGLCIAPGVEIRPWKVGGTGVQTYLETQPEALPTRLEAGTLNGHGIAGLSAAVDYLNRTGLRQIHAHEMALMRQFYNGVVQIPGIRVYGDFTAADRAPIVCLNVGDYDSSEVADELAEVYGIAVRAGAHCAPRLHKALGTQQQGAVRFSFGWFNTAQETDAAIEAIKRIMAE